MVMILPVLIPVRKTRWIELNYRSSKRYCQQQREDQEEAKEVEHEHHDMYLVGNEMISYEQVDNIIVRRDLEVNRQFNDEQKEDQ